MFASTPFSEAVTSTGVGSTGSDLLVILTIVQVLMLIIPMFIADAIERPRAHRAGRGKLIAWPRVQVRSARSLERRAKRRERRRAA